MKKFPSQKEPHAGIKPGLTDIPSVSFNNVSFTYPGAGNEPVLRGINLNIPKGKTTAIVGPAAAVKLPC